jgi:hypothetical protein
VTGVKSIEVELDGVNDLALIGSDDSVWVVVPHRWWDLATLIWWVFMPSDKKSTVTLTLTNKTRVKFRTARVATRHMRVRGFG